MSSLVVSTKSEPVLTRSQLAFRIGLARQRTASYPLHKLDFIMMDLERPDLCTRHAWWCTGDLSGRVLEFLACAEGIDGKRDERLGELFDRIMRTRCKSGLFGRYAQSPDKKYEPHGEDLVGGSHRLFNGLIKYFEVTGDWRGLDAAVGLADWYIARKDKWRETYGEWDGCGIHFWITEPLATLYRHTRERKYLDMIATIAEPIGTCQKQHAHGFLTTMRGLQLAAIYTGDASWNEKPERFRREIIDQRYEYPDGCISEGLPRSFRNEGCAIADWLMLNLNSALISGDEEGYAKAENCMWNAIFFNQFITGGFGHRDMTPWGYAGNPSECWWCCTEDCGLAMAEYARHSVTVRENTVWINLLTGGTFTVENPDRPDIRVTIATSYPAGADAIITARNLPEDMDVKLRVPECIKDATIDEIRTGNGIELRLKGKVGHWVQDYDDQAILRYGPVILAPMIYYWNSQNKTFDGNIPAEYIPKTLPAGIPRIDVQKADENGFVELDNETIPDWSYFDLGPDAELSVEGASANVPVVFDNGEKMDLWFSPMCHLTSDMTFCETPILFKK